MKRHSFLARTAMTLLAMLLTTVTAWAWDGSGTEDDPYLIKTLSDFKEFRTQSQTNSFEGVHFQLEADIEFDKNVWNNFSPTIAAANVPFEGVFDGNYYAIKGIRINKKLIDGSKIDDSRALGIFCEIGEHGVVRNLSVENTIIYGYYMSAIIASYNVGTIENCYIASDVELHTTQAQGAQFGTIAGMMRDGNVDHCISEANIIPDDLHGNYYSIGGLVGQMQGGSITNSVFTGSIPLSGFLSISHNNFAVLGCLDSGTIANCYYTDSSLPNNYDGISLAQTVTFPANYLWVGGTPELQPYETKGVRGDGKFYIAANEPFYVYANTPLGNFFNITKTEDQSVVAKNVLGSYNMPAYDITLSMGQPLFMGQTTSSCCPVDFSSLGPSDFKSQFVVPAEQLADMNGKYITSVTFYVAPLPQTISPSAYVNVYLKEVNNASISSFVAKESATETYFGTLSIVPANSQLSMLTIEFDTPYQYQGGNLLVGIDNDFSSSTGGGIIPSGGKNNFVNKKKVSIGGISIGGGIGGESESTPILFYGQQVDGASVAGSSTENANSIVAEQQNFIPMTSFTCSTAPFLQPKNIEIGNMTTSTANLSWMGNSDNYNVTYRKIGTFEADNKESFDNGLPSGWEVRLGLLSDVMSTGNFYNDWNRWKFGTYLQFFKGFDNHATTNNTNKDHKDWLITSQYTLADGASLNFDLALTDYFGGVETNGVDDRFVVLVTTDNMQTWNILREWNNSGSEYVYNDISQKGENVTLDLSSYAGQDVRIAFYAESTVQNADNYIHIDNVAIGHKIPDGDWQTVSTNDEAVALTGLTPGTKYEVKVRGDYGAEGVSTWTETFAFTTAINVTLANDAANTDVIQTVDGLVACVTLADRTLKKNNEWNTICLPFSLSASQIAASPLAGATIMQMKSETSTFENGVLTLSFEETDNIAVGVPYLIKWANGTDIVNPVFDGVTFRGVTPWGVYPYPISSSDEKVIFMGQYDPYVINSSNKDRVLMLGSGNKIGYSKNDRTLKCFRAHFEICDNSMYLAREIILDFGNGETTALKLVNSEESTVNSNVYDLQGRKVNVPVKGLYISNGKKIVIK